MNGHMFPKTTGTYGIIAGSGLVPHAGVVCVLCQKTIPFSFATAGSLFADSHQAFACSAHLWSRSAWLREWARFEIRQRRVRKLAALIERATRG